VRDLSLPPAPEFPSPLGLPSGYGEFQAAFSPLLSWLLSCPEQSCLSMSFSSPGKKKAGIYKRLLLNRFVVSGGSSNDSLISAQRKC
jgi:hypothetical protein